MGGGWEEGGRRVGGGWEEARPTASWLAQPPVEPPSTREARRGALHGAALKTIDVDPEAASPTLRPPRAHVSRS